ncbi:hypothetical protein VNO78_11920 [Psophocarpus tetragonolobus]|uniref:Uncharacterized protein n=1 Tax=Psophocarpus tetragonolobus TaxID=3891 RepID=A0AAN9SN88_PSOTE
MDSSSKRREESSKTTRSTFPIMFPNDLQEGLFQANSIIHEDQMMEDVQNVVPATTDDIYVSFSGYYLPLNVFDDLMAKLCNDNEIFQLGGNEPFPFDDISLEVLKVVEELEHVLTEQTTLTTQITSNASKEVNVSIPPPGKVVSEASPFSFKGGNSLTQFQSPASASVAGSVPGANVNAGVSVIGCASIGANVVGGVNTSGPNSSSSSHQKFRRYRISSKNKPTHMSIQGLFWPHAPPIRDFSNFVHAWEGCLIGKFHSCSESLAEAKVVRKPTSPFT